jgi:PAS domain S-box-containing protein
VAITSSLGVEQVGKKEDQSEDLNQRLLDLSHELGLAPDFQGAMAILVGQLSDLVPCDGASVMWLDSDHLEVMVSQGSTAPLQGLTLPASQVGKARAALDSGRPIVVADTVEDAHWQQIPGEEGIRSWLGSPLLMENWPLGLLEWTALEPAHFDKDDTETAGEIAHCVAPILHRAQLLEDASQKLREWVEPQMSAVPPAVDLSAELQPIVREALELATVRYAFVFLLDETRRWLRCVAVEGDQQERIKRVNLQGDGTMGGWSVPMGKASDRSGPGPTDREVMADLGIHRTLILPLRVGGEQVGMLGVAEPRNGRAFGRDTIQLMTHWASQASVLVERSYRHRSGMGGHDYESVFQSSPLGIALLAVTGEIRLCNPALSGLLSCSDKGLVGRGLSEFLDTRDGQRLNRALEEVAITGQRRQVHARVRSAPGEYRHMRVSLSLAHTSADAGGNLVAMMEDVTSLKILERERVGHLRQLREKNIQLQDLDQLKSRFVSNVSHELRTPLAVIKLYATLARKGRPEKQVHYLQTIEQETHRLETMVENILDLTRMDRQSLRVNPELLAPGEIIAQVLLVYQEAANKQAVELRNRVRGTLPPLWADKNHLIQMLTNLVDNALKYTPRGGQVWVATREIDTSGPRMLEIAVGDSGIGIPEDEQGRVFDRFYRGSNNTPGTTGTGLGLAIVEELMLQHGGKVTLRSQPGEGSVFALQFPLYDGGRPPIAEDREESE